MTNKKIALLDFLLQEDTEATSVFNEDVSTQSFSYPVSDFITAINNHNGSFLVNNKKYASAIASNSSVYFYNDTSTISPILFIYESLIDIKKKHNAFLLFCDQYTTIEILLT